MQSVTSISEGNGIEALRIYKFYKNLQLMASYTIQCTTLHQKLLQLKTFSRSKMAEILCRYIVFSVERKPKKQIFNPKK